MIDEVFKQNFNYLLENDFFSTIAIDGNEAQTTGLKMNSQSDNYQSVFD